MRRAKPLKSACNSPPAGRTTGPLPSEFGLAFTGYEITTCRMRSLPRHTPRYEAVGCMSDACTFLYGGRRFESTCASIWKAVARCRDTHAR